MKIEEALPNEFVRIKRRANGKTTFPDLGALKKILVVFLGALLCTGSYYYGHKTRQMAVKK